MSGKQRRSQETRRRETQHAIMTAAVAVLSEKGYGGFSSVQVALRAGVSRGALAHYYPDNAALLLAIAQHIIDEAVLSAEERAARKSGQADPIVQFIEDSEAYFMTPAYRGMIELSIAAKRSRAISRKLDSIVLQGRKRLDQTWIVAFTNAGYPEAEARVFVDLTHYLFRGFVLSKAWLPYKPDIPKLLVTWRRAASAALEPATSAASPAPDQKQAGLKVS